MNGQFVRGECKWCGRKKENNPGDYYHEMGCWRVDIIRRMNELDEKNPEHWDKLDRLARELFQASYTGD